jgi:hypothetical protein
MLSDTYQIAIYKPTEKKGKPALILLSQNPVSLPLKGTDGLFIPKRAFVLNKPKL